MSDARAAFTAKIIKDKATTVRDVLASDFGHFPPKGLDILIAPEQPVYLGSMLSAPHKNAVLSMLRLVPRVNQITKITYDQLPASTQKKIFAFTKPLLYFYTAIHSFTHDTGLRFAPVGCERNFTYSPRSAKIPGFTERLNESVIRIMQNDHLCRNNFGMLTSKPYQPMQMKDLEPNKWADDFINVFHEKASALGLFSDGSYLQATLHTMLSNGYREWGQMPVNITQFWAALESLGAKLPQFAENELSMTTRGAEARATFFKVQNPSGKTTAYIQELNKLQTTLKSYDAKADLWNELLPRLYGNLLELYGDRLGRERMGYGKNTKWTGSWLNLLRENAGDAYDIHTVLRWSGQLDTKDAFKALARLVATPITMALPNDELIGSVLFARKDLADYAATKLPDLVMEACANANEPMASGLMFWLCNAVKDQKLKDFRQTDMAHRYAFKYGRHKKCLLPPPSNGVEVASEIEKIGISYLFYSLSHQRQKGIEPDPTLLQVGSHCLSGIQNAKVKLESFDVK